MKLGLTAFILGLLAAHTLAPALAAPAPKPVAPPSSSPVKKTIPILLAENGKALLPIVISANASAPTKAVAGELANYLKRISGADFEVKSGDGSSGIVLGNLTEFPVADLKKPLEIRDNHDGVEAYAIRTEATRVLLLGATDLGASHAAFRFLETLGCRWFFPAREWEVIPPIKSTLRAALNEVSRPVVLSRNIWWSFGLYMDDTNQPREAARLWIDFNAWRRHNRMDSSFLVYAAHAYGTIVESNQKEFDLHPEYYALIDGKRVGWKMCLSNPAVRKMFMKYADEYFVKNPNADMVSFEPNDGDGFCECDECKKLGTISDAVFGLANEAARVLQKNHPGKMVGILAYNSHSDPPSFMMEPNVCVQLATLYTQGKYSFDEQLSMWPQHTKFLGIYDYLSSWAWNQDRLRPASYGGPAASLNYVRDKIGFYVAQGAKTYEAESSNAWGQYGVGYYVTNKLLWNPHVDINALVTDFYDKAFGPAAPAMKRFYERISPDSKPMFGTDLMARAYRDIQEASTLAKDKPDVLARLDGLKQYLHFNLLCWKLDAAGEDKAKQKEIYLQMLTQAYRARYSFMMHSTPMITTWTPYVAKEYNEPNWSYWSDSKDKPWKVETPYTAEEIEKEFQEGLQYFQPVERKTVTFSDDLVPVEFLGVKAPVTKSFISWLGSTQFLQAPARFALYSFKGEPLEFEITEQQLHGSQKLLDADNKVVPVDFKAVSERMAGENKVRKLVLKVPKAGLYYFEEKVGGWWGIGFHDKQPAAVVMPRDRGLDTYAWGGDALYFYVPKGTREIQYFNNNSEGSHKIFNPNGDMVREVKLGTEYVNIPVPEGMDGKIWGAGGRVNQIWFYNCPRVMSAMPDSLMLPRELAEKDGLTIRTE